VNDMFNILTFEHSAMLFLHPHQMSSKKFCSHQWKETVFCTFPHHISFTR